MSDNDERDSLAKRIFGAERKWERIRTGLIIAGCVLLLLAYFGFKIYREWRIWNR